jgi:hypothetical protein
MQYLTDRATKNTYIYNTLAYCHYSMTLLEGNAAAACADVSTLSSVRADCPTGCQWTV